MMEIEMFEEFQSLKRQICEKRATRRRGGLDNARHGAGLVILHLCAQSGIEGKGGTEVECNRPEFFRRWRCGGKDTTTDCPVVSAGELFLDPDMMGIVPLKGSVHNGF